MTTTVEIDKSGRLVLPKKMRDALHLVPGTRVVINQTEHAIVIQPEAKPRGLFMKEGMWVYDPGPVCPEDAINSVHDAREARAEHLVNTWHAQ